MAAAGVPQHGATGMSNFLDNLISRASDSPVGAVLPRLSSRFEPHSGPLLTSETSADSTGQSQPVSSTRPAERHSVNSAAEALVIAPNIQPAVPVNSIQHVTLASDSGPHPIPLNAPQQTETAFEERLAAMSRRLDTMTFRAVQRPVAERHGNGAEWTQRSIPAPPDVTNISIDNSRREFHSHEEHEAFTTTIEQSQPVPVQTRNEPLPTILVNNSDRALFSGRTEDRSGTRTPSDASSAPSPVVPVEPTLPRMAESVKNGNHPVPEIPRIQIDRPAPRPAESRTISVSIGRIEIRATAPAGSTSHAPSRPATQKVMSLDEYLGRRSGGSR